MSYRIASFFSRISDAFPPVGGAAGAVSQAKDFHFLPTWENVSITIILAILGGIAGWLVKRGLDKLACTLKEKHIKAGKPIPQIKRTKRNAGKCV
jgi:tetrahydromethanopterin S-methyltransferase subunit D